MELRLFQVDAFTGSVFGGNPAAVVPLDEWLPDQTLQAIALENNLSETAFFVAAGAADQADYHLRWFTPALEVELCGHATLASAHVLVNYLDWKNPRIRFLTKSGLVHVQIEADRYVLDFPSLPGAPVEAAPGLVEALGRTPTELRAAHSHMAVFATEEEVRSLKPNITKLAALDIFAAIATAPGDADDVDFVSRFFAPRAGIPEDPVTGAAHCTLIPYWAERLAKTDLHALQVSPRGGELFCRHHPDTGRVSIGGHAVTYLEGTILAY